MNARWSPSVTVAAIVCDRGAADGVARWLLVEEHTPEGLKLNNPAGHLDAAEGPLQGVMREALEETGRVFTPDALLGVYLSRFVRPATGEDVTYLRFAYTGTVGEPIEGWALDDGIVRTLCCIEDAAAGVRHPLGLVQVDGSVMRPDIKR
jgi:8-oxo-dGTP pyrophosphatase MutT (NUDIX family)